MEELSVEDMLVDVQRPLTDWIASRTDSMLILWASDNLVEPSIRILTIVVVTWLLVRLIRRAIRRAVARVQDPDGIPGRKLRAKVGLIDEQRPVYSTRRAQRAESIGALATSVVSVAIWLLALFMILATFGLNLGPLIAGAGVVGVAIGFGAQDVVKDFFSGVLMMLEDQYGVGDIIDAGEASGVVEGVSLRTTQIRDVTGTLWHIPNGEIRRIGNMSQEWARALLDVGIAYGADIDAASAIILRVATDMADEDEFQEQFMEAPEIWGVQELSGDSVDIRLVVKTQPGQQWAIARELRRRIKLALDAAKIEIPFAQRTVWLRTEAPVALGDDATPPFEAAIPDDRTIATAAERVRQSGDENPSVDPEQQPPDPG